MLPVFIALVLLDALALWAIIYSQKGWWLAKLGAIILVSTFNFLVYNGAYSADGWPTTQPLPKVAMLDACVVVEPDPLSQSPGSIYIWATPITRNRSVFTYTSPAAAPRSYQVPYTRALHIACLQAKKALGKGYSVGVGLGRLRGNQRSGPHVQAHFYRLPPVVLPRKRAG